MQNSNISVEKLISSPDWDELISNNQQSAKLAIKILLEESGNVYKVLSAREKKNLIMAFVMDNRIIYGKAFDIIKINNSSLIDFSDVNSIFSNIESIVVCEIKSTRKKTKKEKFEGYFFGLTTAELLVAQNLKENYKFIFVNINTRDILELTLQEVFKKAKGIYPQWSISF